MNVQSAACFSWAIFGIDKIVDFNLDSMADEFQEHP